MVSEPVKQMKDMFTELNDPPMVKVVEAIATRSWYLKCAASISMYSLVLIGGENEERVNCSITYWHPFGTSFRLPPVKDMVDSYELRWRLNSRYDTETGMPFRRLMDRLDDLYSNNGEKYFKNRGNIDPDDKPASDRPADNSTELDPLDDLDSQNMATPAALSAAGLALWEARYLDEAIPSLCMDDSLKIMEANASFCSLFGCTPQIAGTYFTQFFAASFDASKSAELFRSVRSPASGYSWHGRVEKIDRERLSIITKVSVLALGSIAGAPPQAYSAVCVDITDEYRHFLQSTLTSLLGAARLKDYDTGNHFERMNRYAKAMAKDLMDRPGGPLVDREFVESIGLVAALHDIGKIGTPEDILNKAGQLENWEWDVVKQHTNNGAYILATYPNPMAREIALRHHERWDGTGNPNGLFQDLIPLSARIVAIADVYDALRTQKSYRNAHTHDQALRIMVAERGTHFDPYLIDRFVETAETFRQIYSERSDS
jgi:HD-GYP domain-containing protein (c-di-GMP phosphodiesterase class II)